MKFSKILILAMITAIVVLTGCSVIEDVSNTINYTVEATDLINDANQFADEIPALATEAIANKDTLETLKQQFLTMKERLVAFSGLVPPGFAEEIHNQLLTYNDTFQQEIDTYVKQIENGEIDLQALAEAPVFDTVQNMMKLLTELNQLEQ
jgi:hypothetical protein